MSISNIRRFIAAHKTEIVTAIHLAAAVVQWVEDMILGATEQQPDKKSPKATSSKKRGQK